MAVVISFLYFPFSLEEQWRTCLPFKFDTLSSFSRLNWLLTRKKDMWPTSLTHLKEKAEMKQKKRIKGKGRNNQKLSSSPSTITDQLKHLKFQGSDWVVTETLVTVKCEKHHLIQVPYMQSHKQGHKAITNELNQSHVNEKSKVLFLQNLFIKNLVIRFWGED